MKRTLLALGAIAALSLAGTASAQGHGGGGAAASANGASHANANSAVSTQITSPTVSAAPATNAPPDAALHGPAQTGQPNAECGSATAPNTPGNAASAPGSAFNPNGTAGQHYAGEQPQNSRNTASVSQYDSACAHQPTPH
ncbi:MAG: hypothetical protein HY054_02930 [Proteobacteria bacterium]|nr:hypothetical protein [Pseudomonadota bacterium]